MGLKSLIAVAQGKNAESISAHLLCMAVSVCYFSREYMEAPRTESRVR